ncbi:MAG: hypothetical protein P4L33_02120 [Capsulimonadaceae bacterium]|nr:hypothetical protein [Capsulimonadaceae bacterium]
MTTNSYERSVCIAVATAIFAAFAPLAISPACRAAEQPATLLAKMTFDAPDDSRAWTEEKKQGDASSEISIDPGNRHSGASALKFRITADIAGERDIFTGVKLSDKITGPGRHLRVRLFSRTAGGPSGDVSFRILERGPSGVIGWLGNKADFIKIDAVDKWIAYEAQDNLSENTTGLTLELAISHANANRTVWIDDLSVEEIPG